MSSHLDNLQRAAAVIEAWLEAQDLNDQNYPELADGAMDDLRRVSALALANAPEPQLAEAVRQARQDGWHWTPIAILIGLEPDAARRRFERTEIKVPRQRTRSE